jgi:hypothetical protein
MIDDLTTRGSAQQLRLGAIASMLLLFVLLAPLATHGATFTAALDRDVIVLGEEANLSLTFEGAEPKDVPTPTGQNVQVTYVGPSRQMSVSGGRMRSTVTHFCQVTPKQVGELTIAPITVNVGGQVLQSKLSS